MSDIEAVVSFESSGSGGPLVWVNGDRRSGEYEAVSPLDRGFTLGDGVFETMRLRAGRLFRFAQHRARLSHALAALEIPEPGALDQWIEVATGAAAIASGDRDLSVRVTVTRGVGPAGVAPVDTKPTVVVTVAPLPEVAPEVYARGLHAHVASGRRNERAMTAGLKTTAYADAVLALLEAKREGADEAIFLDTRGRCSEATASNLFASTRGRLVTPPTDCGVLPGITRAAVIELATGLGFSVGEEAFDLRVLLSADEAFLTSSLRGIAPLVRVDGQPLGTGAPGERTRRLMDAYAALVERECRG